MVKNGTTSTTQTRKQSNRLAREARIAGQSIAVSNLTVGTLLICYLSNPFATLKALYLEGCCPCPVSKEPFRTAAQITQHTQGSTRFIHNRNTPTETRSIHSQQADNRAHSSTTTLQIACIQYRSINKALVEVSNNTLITVNPSNNPNNHHGGSHRCSRLGRTSPQRNQSASTASSTALAGRLATQRITHNTRSLLLLQSRHWGIVVGSTLFPADGRK